MDAERRGAIAAEAVQHSLEGWVKPNVKVTIRPAVVPFNGDARNPITGQGPVEVFVDQDFPVQKGFFGRLRSIMNPFAKQRYLVHVGDRGEAQVLERQSLAPQRRFWRFLSVKMPLGGMLLDFMKSKRATEGVWTFVGATSSAALSPWLSGALFMRLAQVMEQGIASQKEVRKAALDDSVAWAKTAYESSRSWPTLMETYRAYKGSIADRDESVRPLGLGEFAEALSVRQL